VGDSSYARRSARVILLDGGGRVLLFRFALQGDGLPAYAWFTPGGGVADGESLPEAAVRELREETGLIVDVHALGPHVAVTSGYADLGWATGMFRDDFFVHRIDQHEVDTTQFDAIERRRYIGHRWWTVTELESTTEVVFPLGLGPLVADLVHDRLPTTPVLLRWHH